jgi:phosphoribosylformylglycinamidine synthase
MKARVYIRLKPGVLDPQGKAVLSALRNLGFEGLQDVRVGKLIELSFSDGASPEELKEQVKGMCEKLLANTVIEDYSFELEE